MANALFGNNAFGTLASGITNSATSITLTGGQGARFPSITDSNYFYATLIDTSNNLEIVKCTARSTDALTVVRGAESTTARAYSAGDRIELRLTAAGLTDVAAQSAASATAAADSATAAAASYDAFDDRYLGSKSSAPSVDNDGNTLLDGALYWNTSSNDMYVYDLGNTAWVTVSNSTTSTAAAASATLSANYAIKINGAVTGSDYASKAWAIGGTGVTTTGSRGAAKEWATTTGGAVDTSEYSSKEYAIGTTATSSKSYALKVDGAVTGSDYAAKAWAIGGTGVTTTSARGAAKEWATSTGAAVDTSEFSSKEYSQGTTVTTGSAKQWALGGGSFAVDTVVAGGVYSAKKYAANAAASATLAASGQLYSTVVNQTGAALSPALSADGTYYLCDTSSNNITVTLPAIGTSEGTKYAFQKTSASNSLIFQRSGSDTLNGSASNITITDVNAQIQFVADDNSPDNWVAVQMSQITVGAGLTKVGSVVSIADNGVVPAMVQGTVNAQTGTAYTSVIGDAFKTITMSNTSANKVTLPPNSSVPYAVGDRIDIVMLNSGVTSVQGGSGVTVNGVSTGTGAIAAQYGAVSCLKIATNTWLLMGNHGGVA